MTLTAMTLYQMTLMVVTLYLCLLELLYSLEVVTANLVKFLHSIFFLQQSRSIFFDKFT